jgi:biopolymer transport protein ExbD
VKFYTRPRRTPQVIIVSLIDIFAILLIFVIVTTTFKRAQPEVTIKLPESKSAVASAEKSDEPVVLTVSASEEVFFGKQKVTLKELTAAVQKLAEEKGTPKLAMAADDKVSYGFLIKVLDALKAAGVTGNLSAFTEAKK